MLSKLRTGNCLFELVTWRVAEDFDENNFGGAVMMETRLECVKE